MQHLVFITGAVKATLFVLASLASVSALTAERPLPIPLPVAPHDHIPVHTSTGATIPPYNTTYYFEQLIDHNDTTKGTFTQRYWATWEFYEKGVYLFCFVSVMLLHLMQWCLRFGWDGVEYGTD